MFYYSCWKHRLYVRFFLDHELQCYRMSNVIVQTCVLPRKYKEATTNEILKKNKECWTGGIIIPCDNYENLCLHRHMPYLRTALTMTPKVYIFVKIRTWKLKHQENTVSTTKTWFSWKHVCKLKRSSLLFCYVHGRVGQQATKSAIRTRRVTYLMLGIFAYSPSSYAYIGYFSLLTNQRQSS